MKNIVVNHGHFQDVIDYSKTIEMQSKDGVCLEERKDSKAKGKTFVKTISNDYKRRRK